VTVQVQQVLERTGDAEEVAVAADQVAQALQQGGGKIGQSRQGGVDQEEGSLARIALDTRGEFGEWDGGCLGGSRSGAGVFDTAGVEVGTPGQRPAFPDAREIGACSQVGAAGALVAPDFQQPQPVQHATALAIRDCVQVQLQFARPVVDLKVVRGELLLNV